MLKIRKNLTISHIPEIDRDASHCRLFDGEIPPSFILDNQPVMLCPQEILDEFA
jgi:hypothetical protein